VASIAWGDIIGTLGNQSDLASALNAKLDSATAASTYYLQTNPDGFIGDAPSDGSTYGRNNGAWTVAGGGGSYLPLAGGALDANASITASDTSTATDSELAGWGLGVQLSADHTQGTTLEFDGLDAYDGASHMQVTPTGLTFPDSTVQTTAYTGGYSGQAYVYDNGHQFSNSDIGKIFFVSGSVNYVDFSNVTSSGEITLINSASPTNSQNSLFLEGVMGSAGGNNGGTAPILATKVCCFSSTRCAIGSVVFDMTYGLPLGTDANGTVEDTGYTDMNGNPVLYFANSGLNVQSSNDGSIFRTNGVYGLEITYGGPYPVDEDGHNMNVYSDGSNGFYTSVS
jgi:hypothetical protein